MGMILDWGAAPDTRSGVRRRGPPGVGLAGWGLGDGAGAGVDPRILHCVPGLDPRQGGPSRTVVALTDALACFPGVAIWLLSQGIRNGPTVRSREPRVTRMVVASHSRLALALALPVRRGLRGAGATAVRPALIHSHGVWHPANHWSARAARAWGVPLIIHPRGMLEPWALGQKALKKRLALKLFQRAELDGARALVATSEMEYENLRRFGLRQPVALIPNGVDLAGLETAGISPRIPERERLALFLSRVHPKKGVLELVRAWGQIAPVGWRLCIAGPDEGGHWGAVARIVERLRLGSAVDYAGPVEGAAKAALYREADLFVLPTFSENFGMVVAEALSYGVPVITTQGAPWAELETYRCGWWIATGVAPLAAALGVAMSLTDDERWAMGERGRAYVRRFAWEVIAGQTLDLYRWVLGRGDRPAGVRVD
jgi:glycosyltransferase involved in cell wall biosynthesis